MVYDASIDRILYLGRQDAPNVLNVAPDVYRRSAPHAYCFRGGAYTWLAPQEEWIFPAGQRRLWPPEPEMDSGPMQLREITDRGIEVMGPVLSRQIRLKKKWQLQDDGTLNFATTLLPEKNALGRASIWSTVAVPRGTFIAVHKGPIRFDNTSIGQAWTSHVKEEGDWQLIDTELLRSSGKVFLSAAPVIATWREGQWLLRIGSDGSSPRHPADTPVEIYVNLDTNIIEAELIGPYEKVLPKGSNHWEETWQIIPTKQPDLKYLDGAFRQMVAQAKP